MYLRVIEIFKRIDSITKLQKAMGLKEILEDMPKV
jgi:hypothetical protein